MQIVIDIPDKLYKKIENCSFDAADAADIAISVKYGKPLLKGYGRLMILSENKLKENQINLDSSCRKWISEFGLSNATIAIIEADKIGSEE